MDKVIKIFNSETKQIGDEKDRTIQFVTSTESVDRDGDRIDPKGWKLDNYLKNPVILYAHDYRSLPVGKSVKTEVLEGKLVQHIKFADKETYPFADTVYRLVKEGYLNATSVGFVSTKAEKILDEEEKFTGYHFREQELLETSIVPVPSNPTALVEARSKGIIDDEEFEKLQSEKEAKKSEIPIKVEFNDEQLKEIGKKVNEFKAEFDEKFKDVLEENDVLKEQIDSISKELHEIKIKINPPPMELDIESIELENTKDDNFTEEDIANLVKELIQSAFKKEE